MTTDAITPPSDRLEAEILRRVETIRQAFAAAGVQLLPDDASELRRLATWGHFVDDRHLYQDERSKAAVEGLAAAASALRAAIAEALNVFIVDMQIGTRVNVAEYLECAPHNLDDLALQCVEIEMAAEQALRVGRRHSTKGRPRDWAYRAFVLDLHRLYTARTGRRDAYQKGGTAGGRFVELVTAAQAILPKSFRLTARETIGNRVLAALAEINRQPA